MIRLARWSIGLWALIEVACVDYTPKPRGYVRIEPAASSYQNLDLPELPFLFDLSSEAIAQLPDKAEGVSRLTLVYPSLKASLYCNCLSITPQTFAEADRESRRLVVRHLALPSDRIQEQVYTHPEESVYGSLFLLEGNTASPIQFQLTDSVALFLRGALYFDCKPNADSLAPAIDYLRRDVVELMQTFRWRRQS